MSASNATDGAPPPRVLLAHHLRQLKLPTFLREYEKVAAEAARGGLDHVRFLLRLVELELIDRERRMVERRIRAARFPAVKSFDTFDFTAIPRSISRSRWNWRDASLSSPATTSSLWATAEPERRTSPWRSASPPVSADSPWRSIRRPGSCIS
jgi:IstB-like ATP binding protein